MKFSKFKKKLRLKLSHRDWLMMCVGAVIAFAGLGVGMFIRDLRAPLAPESATITAKWIPETVARWHEPIEEMAKKYDIDPNLLAIIMTMESGGDPKADSGQAQGLMQIAPATGGDIAKKYLKTPVNSYDLWDPKTNIEFGAAYLAHLRDVFGSRTQAPSWNETVELVAAGYNGGPVAANNLEQGRGMEGTQTVVYSRDAFNMWRERHAEKSPTFDRWKERGGVSLIDGARSN
jgi:soluble lytic murein transglycosylase-like protein